MTAPAWTDRSLPLAERVLRLVNEGSTLSGAEYAATLDELLADIAAADELARAAKLEAEASEKWGRALHAPDATRESVARGRECAWDATTKREKALAAYRARMAQGVTDG